MQVARKSADASIGRLQRMTAREFDALLSGDQADAARWVQLAATHGMAAAQVRLGRMLLDGTGLAEDKAAALGWFKTAARSGDAEAMNMVGRAYENGWGGAKDNVVAADWYRRSAALGYDWGEYNYANMLFDGLGVAVDLRLALDWYLKAAAQGHSRAMNQIARCYEEGWGVAKDFNAAADWYRRSAEGGYFRGQYNYATLLCLRRHFAEAARWFGKAAEGGSREIRRRIGRELLGKPEAVFHEVGLRAMALACRDGEPADFYHYGRVLLHGYNCRNDVPAGLEWLRKASEAGHEGAAAELMRRA